MKLEINGRKLLGFQVADMNGEYPEDYYSFEVLPLETCLVILLKDQTRWRLIPIFEGDIEEPTIYAMVGGVETIVSNYEDIPDDYDELGGRIR